MWSSMNPFLVHLIFLMVMSSLTNGSEESNNTSILFEDIFKGYNKLSYPKKLINFNKTVRVEFDFQLINILDVSARNQYIKTYAWVNQYWTNELLTWDPTKYGGIEEIHVDPNAIWVPDILLYSNIDEEDRYGGGRYTYKANVALRYDGRCTWLNPAIYKSICSVDVTFFPFDDQQCTLKFGSWSFDISKIDLYPQDKNVMNNNYIKNGEWCIRGIHAQRNRKTYKCCVHDFVDVTVTIDISRVSLDYITKLIIPCSLISSMIFLGFVLPPESGERIGLSITVLLAMTVFQQLTSELMPSYGFPLLGQYYFATMMEIGASLAVTTFILNFYHRSTRRMPHCLRKIILVWLSRVAFPFSKSRRYEAECGGYANKNHSDANQESPEESDSYSRVENLIDSNDYVTSNRNLSWGGVRDFTGSQFEMRPTNSTVDDSYSNNHNSSNTPHTTRRGILRKSRRHKSNRNGTNRQSPRKRKTSYFVSGVGFGGLRNHEDTQTQYISPEQERNQNEWMRAARVLDRLFLIISVVIGTVTLFAIFLRAPRFSLDYDNSQCSTT